MSRADNPNIRTLMVVVFGVGALWDGLTTVFGIASILGADDLFGYAGCLVGGTVILGFGVGTRVIFAKYEMPFPVVRVMWFFTLTFDAYTSFMGNVQYIVLRRKVAGFFDVFRQVTFAQFVVTAGLTILICASPIILSYLWEDH